MEDEEIVIDLGDLWNALKKKREFIAKVTGAVVLVAGVGLFAMNPGYESKALLRVQPPRSLNKSMLDTQELTNNSLAAQYMATYSQIMTSRSVMYEVIKGMKNPADEGKSMDALYEAYSKRVKTAPVKNATVMEVTITGKEGEETQKFSQLLMNVFFTKVASIGQGDSKNTSEFVAGKLAGAKADMEKAESNLRDFQAEHKVLSPEEDVKVASQKISMANNIRAQSEVEMRAAEARLAEVTAKLSENGHIMADNETISEYRKKLAALSADKVNLENKFTDKHPQIIAINEQIAGVEEKLQREINNIVGMQSTSSNKAYQDLLTAKINSEIALAVNRSKLEAVRALEEEYAKNVATLSANRQKFAQLSREVAVTRDIYVMLSKRLEEAKVASSADSGSVQIVDPPITNKAKGGRALKLALAFLLGLFGSSGYVIARELLNPTVKKADDIVEQLNLPLLADVPAEQEGQLAAYRVLRTNLMAQKDVQTILFASSSDGEVKSGVVSEVAKLMAKAGLKVALLNTSGLTNLVTGAANMQASTEANLSICQGASVDGGEVLAGKAVESVLNGLKSQYDYVLIDSSVASVDSESTIICNKVDGLVEVIKAEVLSPKEVQATIAAFKQAGAKILGAVLCK